MQTAQPRAVLSLLAVLIVAKTIMLAGRDVALTPWLPLAYFWQDVLVAVLFGVGALLIRRPALTWTFYAIVAAYVALNVPISLELSTPLSVSMLRAARGPLGDSVAAAFTARNVGVIAIVVATAIAMPWLLRRVRNLRVGRTAAVAAIAWVVCGAVVSTQIDTRGLHRNAIGALLPPTVPVSASALAAGDLRAPIAPADSSASRVDLLADRGAARGQNVLLITLESTAARYLGVYGAAADPMPNLTKLARRATVFDRMYTVYPESIKGLFTTICSRAPGYNTDPEIYADVPCDATPQVFKDAGYRTALFHSGRFDYLGMRGVIDQRGFDTLEDAGAIGGNINSSFGIDDTSTVDHILKWIDGLKSGERFFATYMPIAGHHPYATTITGPFKGDTLFSQYQNALFESDVALGRLLDGLRARKHDRDTLIVIYGDHGEGFDQHDGNRGHTLFVYDENVRVPFLYALPGWGDDAAPATRRHVTRASSLLDTAPTILDLVGLPRQRRHHGVSLLDPTPRMALYFTDYSLGWIGLADGCWTYRYQVESERSELFDVCRDPDEKLDRAREFAGRITAYRNRVTAWIQQGRETILR